ncbi:FadR/GntR family transcriptional regulator [Mycobacterium montefiorense]|uniref:FadR/GntR family transcriptional regulator n=1 Tax=Mycobacterium montefiorense TaxID=154654 RepID=UPI0021DD8CCE|nr:FCD domain-containing protein [Mycobacterium montefiorense]MCV7427404.1 FadR family transcriptional regulator [Mycobacterium montefiorense]GLE52334.1 GntR family transcriptional regulator [Mycobacterium montefiorense]
MQDRSPATTGPILRTTSATAVRDELVTLIRSGHFPVGNRLPGEIALARSFGVSRPVLREALGGLRAAGMIESRSGAGTFVISATGTDAGLSLLGTTNSTEFFEVRSMLEVPGAGLAAQRRSTIQLDQLLELAATNSEDADVVTWVRNDLRFHTAIAEMTGNSLHVRLISQLRELQFEQTVQTARRLGGLGAPTAEHAAIVDAIAAADAEGAKAAMAAHLRAIQERAQIAQAYGER